MNSTRESAAREVSPRMESSDSDSDEDEGGDERTFMFSLFKDTNSDAALAQTARGMSFSWPNFPNEVNVSRVADFLHCLS